MSKVDLIQLPVQSILHIWLVIAVIRSGARRRFPWFFAYCIYAVLGLAARFLAAISSRRTYFYTYWYTDPGFLLLGIAALHEVFRQVFAGFYLLRWFRWLYYGGITIVVLIAVVNSLVNRPMNVYPVFGIILDVGIAVNCIQAAIFALFYFLAKVLDVEFRRHTFGIVLGFGISSIGTLIPYVARSTFGTKFESLVIYAPSVAYFVSLAVWLSAFLWPEPTQDDQASTKSPEEMAEEVREYLKVLRGFFRKQE